MTNTVLIRDAAEADLPAVRDIYNHAVEHTTAIYSGLLRMADLLALQPNMDIRLHIAAPLDRRDKVRQEILRPTFSLLERGALYKKCTYLAYSAVDEMNALPHLEQMKDSIVEKYEEVFADEDDI